MTTITVRDGLDSVVLPIFLMLIPAGLTSKKTVKLYTPFRAMINPSWWPIQVCPIDFNYIQLTLIKQLEYYAVRQGC